MDPERAKYFEDFKANIATLWVIQFTSPLVAEGNILLRKLDDEHLGLPAWRRCEGAEAFIQETAGLSSCMVVSVTFLQLKQMLAKMEESVRKRIVLDLI